MSFDWVCVFLSDPRSGSRQERIPLVSGEGHVVAKEIGVIHSHGIGFGCGVCSAATATFLISGPEEPGFDLDVLVPFLVLAGSRPCRTARPGSLW